MGQDFLDSRVWSVTECYWQWRRDADMLTPPPPEKPPDNQPTSFLVEEERVLFWHYSSEDWNFVIVNREPTVFIVEDDLHGRSECPVRSAIDERHAGFWSKVLVLQEAISNTELFNEKRKGINLLNKLQRTLIMKNPNEKIVFLIKAKYYHEQCH